MDALVIKNGVVVNCIVIDDGTDVETFRQELGVDALINRERVKPANIGWLYDGQNFSQPPADE